MSSIDAYDQPDIELDSYCRLQDEYTKLKVAYQCLRKEHINLKAGVVATVDHCWEKIDRQYNCKNVSMSGSLKRQNSVDLHTVLVNTLVKDLRTQMETMLRQVYLNCEFKKTLEVEKMRDNQDDVKNCMITDLTDYEKNLDRIQKTTEAFNIMLDNITFSSLVENAPDETDIGRIDLSNKTIAQVLSSMTSVLEERQSLELPQQLQELQKLCFHILSNKATLIVEWNNQFLKCADHSAKPPRRSLRRVRDRLKARSSRTSTEAYMSNISLDKGVEILGNV